MDLDIDPHQYPSLERVGKTPATGLDDIPNNLPHPNSRPDPVAHTEPVFTMDGKNPVYYNDILFELLLQLVVKTGNIAPIQVKRFFQEIKKTGLLTPNILTIYYYFVSERAATSPIIKEALDMPHTSVINGIQRLVKNGLLITVTKTNAFSQGGAKCNIYAVPDYSPDDIRKCHIKQSKRKQPIYESSRRIAASLDDYMINTRRNEITRNHVIQFIKQNFDLNGGNRKFVIEQALGILEEKGYKVWR